VVPEIFFSSTLYLLMSIIITIILVSPYTFLLSFLFVTSIMFGETFENGSYMYPSSGPPLLNSFLYLLHGLLLSYHCIEALNFHHPGVLLGIFLSSPQYVTKITLVDITGKSNMFPFAPYATVSDLRSQINNKFQIGNPLYWLSCCGKPLYDSIKLNSFSGTVFMNGRLLGGMQCCIRGCENEAGSRKFDCMKGRYELKCNPSMLTTGGGNLGDLKELRVCDKHYSSLFVRGHNPVKGKKASKSRSDAQLGILKTTPCTIKCSQCNQDVVLSSDSTCKKHNINVFNNSFSVACNFLDESQGSKTYFNNELYYALDESQVRDFICTACQPFFLNAIQL
jgi:hypothetical protein